MRRVGMKLAGVAGTAAAVLCATQAVEGQWNSAGRNYYHAPAGGPPDYTTWGGRTSFYGGSAWSPSYSMTPSYGMTPDASYAVPSTGSYPLPGFPSLNPASYGAGAYGGATYSNPRGRLSYDVYTPYGKEEHNYRFKRDGFRFDIDD